jgi:MarR family transcriptional regulator, organic hydroperoxide resistance regulator
MRPEEELRFLILGAQREGSRTLSAQLSPLGLTPSQAEVIRCLDDHGPMSLKALGELLVCESGSPSRLVNALVARDLVARVEDPEDRRQVVLTLSRPGSRLSRKVRNIEEQIYARIGAGLGRDGTAAALMLLRPLVAGTLSGNAIARRTARSTAPSARKGAAARPFAKAASSPPRW